MTSTTAGKPVRERILDKAFECFYRQGYRATGINQLIAESGVAKASFYDHFPSKKDLLHAYLRRIMEMDNDDLRSAVARGRTVRARFLAPMRLLGPWFESTDFRGCPFQNILAEAAGDEEVHRLALEHRRNLLALFEELGTELAQSDPSMAHIKPKRIAEIYEVLLEGAIAAAVSHRSRRPVARAIEALEASLK